MVGKTVYNLHKWVDKLYVERVDAKASAKRAKKNLRCENTKLNKLTTVSLRHPELPKNTTVRLDKVKSDLP